MTEVAFRSAAALAAAIHRREIGSRELLEHYLARVDRYNAALNAIIVTDLERARRRADEADTALARGENWGPLHGLPMTVKESFDVIGMPTTWGLPELEGNLPQRMRWRSTGCSVPKPSSSARPTSRSCSPIRKAITRSTGRRTIPGTVL
jgi:Asp-tRNA(Asn)/Glu-tRNA(Gln) amidotransferase A subunit family amidase